VALPAALMGMSRRSKKLRPSKKKKAISAANWKRCKDVSIS
jgi:hypothetical protein